MGVKMVAGGGEFFDPEVAGIIIRNNGERKKQEEPLVLTKKQKQVLYLIANGFITKEIGAKMFLSERTIDDYRNTLMEILQATNTGHLISIAYCKGLIDIGRGMSI